MMVQRRRPPGFIEPCLPSKATAFLAVFERMIEQARRQRLQ
jgi:hypothetical protein